VKPAVPGVRNEEIACTDGSGAGYLITLVPKSEGTPHMAAGTNQHRYYFRAGESFLPMEEYMIADRYQRRPQPKLQLTGRLARLQMNRDLVSISVELNVQNVGKGIARRIMVGVYRDDNGPLSALSHGNQINVIDSVEPIDFTESFKEVELYPSTEKAGCFPTFNVGGPDLRNVHELKIRHVLFCDGFEGGGELVFPHAQVFDFVQKQAVAASRLR
jgi:hypothetical protein